MTLTEGHGMSGEGNGGHRSLYGELDRSIALLLQINQQKLVSGAGHKQ
jgi:hypothetical protein